MAGTADWPATWPDYHAHFPHWQHEPEVLVRALQLPGDEIWQCHLNMHPLSSFSVLWSNGIEADKSYVLVVPTIRQPRAKRLA